MSATYTVDIFSSLDGFGAHSGDWGGYWGKQGPELLEHRLRQYSQPQHLVLGATTYRTFPHLAAADLQAGLDPWVARMLNLPTTVVSSTLQEPLDRPATTVANGNAVDTVARLKQTSAVPLRSHGSLSLNRALLAAGLVDRLQVTIFPVITGRSGADWIFDGMADYDLDLIESQTFDGRTMEVVYRPTPHRPPASGRPPAWSAASLAAGPIAPAFALSSPAS
jgi:dihydrofolate reductase